MSMSLRELLTTAPSAWCTPQYESLPDGHPPVVSQKNWTNDYPPVSSQFMSTDINPDMDRLAELFGPENDLDNALLSGNVHPINSTTEVMCKEGDTVRCFYTYMAYPVMLAFQSVLTQRSESGPLGSTSVNQTVDFLWGRGSSCVLIGELKRHGLIQPQMWTGMADDTNRKRLGRELRGYCHKYKCATGMVFDGKYLLVLVFLAEDGRNQIMNANCRVHCLIFPLDSSVLLYAFFRLATMGLRRCQAASAPPVAIGGYTRRFQWWSGNPMWVDVNDGKHANHPGGFTRAFDQGSGAWYWVDVAGQTVLDGQGNPVWDTQRLW